MPPPKEPPRYIYKILDEAPPSPLPATLPPLSDLDQKDGFVHLSTARQVPSTAARFFSAHATLYLVKVRLADNPDLARRTRWEAPSPCPPRSQKEEGKEDPEQEDAEFFPHLYGGSFGAADVRDVRQFARGAAGDDGGGAAQEGWLDVFARGENASWLE